MPKHLIFFNTKGGVSKSTLCEYSARHLSKNHKISVESTDQQNHVTLIKNESADFFLYDTIGAFTDQNIELLQSSKSADSLIIVPMNIGENDFNELDFLIRRLDEYGLLNKSFFVLTKSRKNSKLLKERKKIINNHNLNLIEWVMPSLDDFAAKRNTKRTNEEIQNFIKEILS